MTLEEYAKDQLGYAYARIAADKETCAKIKNWCITIWIGSLAVVNSNNLKLTLGQKVALPLLPICFFWVLDAIEHVWIKIHITRAKHLEEILLGLRDTTADELKRLSLESWYRRRGFKENVLSVLRHVFTTETVSVFYGTLMLVTALFYSLLSIPI